MAGKGKTRTQDVPEAAPRSGAQQIEQIPVADLIPYARNARTHSEEQVGQIAGSIQEFGFNVPVLIDGQNSIIAGHGRVLAAQRLKLDTVPCIRLTHLTDAQRRAYILADNRIALNSGWDEAMLQVELEELRADDVDLGLLGFDAGELEKLLQLDLSDSDGEIVEDEAPEPPADPITKPGDLWILGEHRLLCGDSTKAEDVEHLMDGKEVGCVVTDPPYGMAFRSNHRTVQHEEIAGDLSAGLLQHTAAIAANHSVYMWCRWDNLPEIPKPKSLITWVKNNWSMGDLEHEHARQTEVCAFYPGHAHRWMKGRPADVLMHARTGNELHPTQKPVSLIAEVVAWTDGLIYDPFLGSGTTLIAAEQLGRKCYGMEISPAYCDVIVKRWETLTGKTAVLDGQQASQEAAR